MKFIPKHTKAYLGLLLRVSPEEVTKQRVTFTLIPESPEAKADSNRPIQAYKSFDEYDMTLEDLNQRGYGIFVSVNHSGSNLRTKNDIQQIRAVQADFDFKSAEPENDFETSQQVSEFCASLPLTPDLIVVSGHGYHTYWIFPEPLTNTLINRERCELVMQGIAQKYRAYGADPAVADIARVLRVPGYNNVKADPQLVRLLESSDGYYEGTSQEYLDELLEAYPAQTTQQIRVEYEQTVEDETKLALAKEWLSNKEPSVQGDGGSNACMSAAWVGPGFNLDKQTTLNLMLEIFNPTCNPTWSIEELKHKINGAYESAQDKGMIGCYLPDYQRQAAKQALLTCFEVEDVQATEAAFEPEDHTPVDQDKELDRECSLLTCDDVGLAQRLTKRYKPVLRWCNNKWFYFNGKYWKNKKDAPQILLLRCIKKIKLREPLLIDDMEFRTKYVKWSNSIGAVTRVEGAIRLAKNMLLKDTEFKSEKFLINFQNGTVDLRTGELREHQASDGFLYCLPYNYNPDAKSEAWDYYLKGVFENNNELIDYVQNLLGCTLLSYTDDEFSVWLTGDGSNGKTTFTDTITCALGSLAQQIPNDIFLTKRNGNSHPTEIARLHNIKFATCSDISLNAKLDEGQFKRLVSTGKVTGRLMFKDYDDFEMTHKFWICVNNLPSVHDESYGLWRRMIVIPFNHKFTPEDRDDTIKMRLKSQIEGIWAWMVRGSIQFTKIGLMAPPESVKQAAEQWKEIEDWWASFVEDKCVIDPKKRVTSSNLYDSYREWARDNNQNQMSHRSFSNRVKQAGYNPYRTELIRGFIGIGIKFDDYDSNTQLL